MIIEHTETVNGKRVTFTLLNYQLDGHAHYRWQDSDGNWASPEFESKDWALRFAAGHKDPYDKAAFKNWGFAL